MARYRIEKNGRVWSEKSQKYLKCTPNDSGYRFIKIYDNGGSVSMRVSRLVAKKYVPNPENKPYVNHIDGDKLNDHYTNLEWSTHAENVQHAYGTGLKKCPVKMYKDGEFIRKFSLPSKADDWLEMKRGTVSDCLRGKRKQAKGYNFKR